MLLLYPGVRFCFHCVTHFCQLSLSFSSELRLNVYTGVLGGDINEACIWHLLRVHKSIYRWQWRGRVTCQYCHNIQGGIHLEQTHTQWTANAFLHSVISLTKCIVIVRVGKYRGCLSVCVCVCACVCLCVCLLALERRNYWVDFNETYHRQSPICLVVCVWVSAH